MVAPDSSDPAQQDRNPAVTVMERTRQGLGARPWGRAVKLNERSAFPVCISHPKTEETTMRTTTMTLAAAMILALSGSAFAQTATGGGSAERNMTNPGSVKSNSEKGMERSMGAPAGGAAGDTTGSTSGHSGGANTSGGATGTAPGAAGAR
jgi:hypothetical protein